MKRILTFSLMVFMAVSCASRQKTKGLLIPIIEYNPATYLSDIENALANPSVFECLTADSPQLSCMDREILEYLSEHDIFIVSLREGDTESAPKFIGIKDKEKGYLKYLNVEKEQYLYSLDTVINDLYGSLDEYIASWPEDHRHLFYDNPQGLYTFPVERFAINVTGYGNSSAPDNPAKFTAAISYLRTTRPEWNDDIWTEDSTEIVKFSDSITGAIIEYSEEKARFEGQDANYFSKWVKERLTYPDASLKEAAIGRVTIQFKIDMFGNLEDVKVLRGRHPALDSIAFHVVSSSPKWTPAKDFVGNPRSVTYTFPVIFTPEMMSAE